MIRKLFLALVLLTFAAGTQIATSDLASAAQTCKMCKKSDMGKECKAMMHGKKCSCCKKMKH